MKDPSLGNQLYADVNATDQCIRACIVSHAYIAVENRKNIEALSQHSDLRVIVPNIPVGPFATVGSEPSEDDSDVFVWRNPIWIGGEMLLASFGGILAAHAPDIVVLEYNPWQPIALETLLLMRTRAPHSKLIMTIKKNTYLEQSVAKEAVKQSITNIVRRHVSGWIACSRMAAALLEDCLGIDRRSIHVCHHLGVDLGLFRPNERRRVDPGVITVGYVGALDVRKGVPELVNAVERLVEEKQLHVRLRLLGNGSLRGELRERALRSCWISVEGPVQHADVAPFLRECDVFAFPSRILPDHHEHDAHALMEAMATGLPVVTTRSGIIPELVNPACAILVPCEDARSLSAALEALVKDKARREEMGRASRRIAERGFGIDVVAERRLTIWNKVVATTGGMG